MDDRPRGDTDGDSEARFADEEATAIAVRSQVRDEVALPGREIVRSPLRLERSWSP